MSYFTKYRGWLRLDTGRGHDKRNEEIKKLIEGIAESDKTSEISGFGFPISQWNHDFYVLLGITCKNYDHVVEQTLKKIASMCSEAEGRIYLLGEEDEEDRVLIVENGEVKEGICYEISNENLAILLGALYEELVKGTTQQLSRELPLDDELLAQKRRLFLDLAGRALRRMDERVLRDFQSKYDHEKAGFFIGDGSV